MLSWRDFQPIGYDRNGNKRHAVHYLHLLTDAERDTLPDAQQYETALKRAKEYGGKAYRAKYAQGLLVFQESAGLIDTLARQLMASAYK